MLFSLPLPDPFLRLPSRLLIPSTSAHKPVMQKDTNVSTELGSYMSVNRTFTKNSKRLFLITHCFLLTLLIEGNILKQTGNGCAVVVYRSAFTCLAIMSSFQLPLHDFYSGLKGKKAVSMSLMFSLTVKTIRGNILIIDLK